MMLCNGCHFNMYPMCTILISYYGITVYNDLMHTSMLDCMADQDAQSSAGVENPVIFKI